MLAGIDTDFLVALTICEHDAHRSAVACRDRHRAADGRFALAPQVVAEFLHVVTDPRRFSRPLSMEIAVGKALEWIEAREVTLIAPDVDSLRLFTSMMIERRFGRKRILDTMLAAACLEAGIHDLITGNAEHFRDFAGLRIHDFRSEIGDANDPPVERSPSDA
jgi:predicted nucleic acid-binding protein